VPDSDRPKVLVLPPVLIGGLLLAGVLAHFFVWPVTPFPVVVSRIAGATLFLLGGVVAHLAHNAFQRVETNVLPTRPARALATDGPYKYSRNPIYVAGLLVYLGVALWVDSLVLLLASPLVFAGLHYGVVLPEEEYLARKFGEAYSLYRRRVRRWL
jgi:protein-S-isoprenylcysteine O-methyltransferase Ste14